MLSLIFIFCYNINSQDILWKKNFGLTTADDFGRAVVETNHGGISIAGYTGSYGAGGFDVWLIKTDADGNILWSKTYGGLGDDYAYSLKQTDDGGFIIGGATNSFGVGGLDYYLIKTDSLSDTLWTKTFGGVNDDICWSLALADDGYVIAGGKNMQPDHPDIWIIKLDTIGNFIWEKTYGTSADEIAWSIEVTSDHGYIIASQNPINSYDGWLIKINSNGDSLWTKFYGEDLGDLLLFATQTQDGGYILTGRFSEHTGGYTGNVWLLKTDSLGNTEWEKTYDYQNDYDIGYSVQQTIDGGYIICGSGEWDVNYGWIIRTDSVGDTLWTKSIESYSKLNNFTTLYTVCFSVIQASNGDYIVAGNQPQLPPSDHAQQVMLLRIASDIVPVELTSFTATVQRNSVSLNWQTATETNNSGFELQRSEMSNVKSQTDWQVIGFVPGFGTTTEPKSYSFIDENLSVGNYQYRLKQIDFDGSFEYSNTVEVEISSPTEFSLEQNYPNPFNPSTNIQYTISRRQFVTIKIFNSLGEEIETLVNEFQDAGVHSELYILHSTLPSGVYYYQLNAGGQVLTRKMILMK